MLARTCRIVHSGWGSDVQIGSELCKSTNNLGASVVLTPARSASMLSRPDTNRLVIGCVTPSVTTSASATIRPPFPRGSHGDSQPSNPRGSRMVRGRRPSWPHGRRRSAASTPASLHEALITRLRGLVPTNFLNWEVQWRTRKAARRACSRLRPARQWRYSVPSLVHHVTNGALYTKHSLCV